MRGEDFYEFNRTLGDIFHSYLFSSNDYQIEGEVSKYYNVFRSVQNILYAIMNAEMHVPKSEKFENELHDIESK